MTINLLQINPTMYEPGNEKAMMAGNVYMPVTQPVAMAHEPQIQRTRKTLVILLGVLLAFSVVAAISTVFESSSEFQKGYNSRGAQFGNAIVSILFYSFGIFVAHRYHATGIRVFAWLGVVQLVFLGIVGIGLLFVLIASLVAGDGQGDTKGIMMGLSVLMVFGMIACVVLFIVQFIIVRLAFRLARLIEANKKSNNQPV